MCNYSDHKQEKDRDVVDITVVAHHPLEQNDNEKIEFISFSGAIPDEYLDEDNVPIRLLIDLAELPQQAAISFCCRLVDNQVSRSVCPNM